MKLVILSGRSGSGKTTGLQALEDLGYYCVDNLPLALLPMLAKQVGEDSEHIRNIAVGIDARNLPGQLRRFNSVLEKLRSQQVECDVVFLDADNTTLLNRFSATRRKHPLSNEEMSLSEAIVHEGELLGGIREAADLVIDTSVLDVHTLRNMIRDRVAGRGEGLSLLVESFSYKEGVPQDADVVFDVRVLPNPYWNPELRDYSGKDQPVIDFLDAQTDSREMLDDITRFLLDWLPRYEANDRSYMTVAVGCTGGRHRSVYIVERLTQRLRAEGHPVQVRHRQLPNP